MERKKIRGLTIIFTKNNMTIKESYKITNIRKMRLILQQALDKTEIYLTDRSINSLVNEWLVHNFCYKTHLFRKRTQNCNFQASINPFIKIIYFIGSFSFKKIYYYLSTWFYFLYTKEQEYRYDKYISQHRKDVLNAFLEMRECSFVYQLGGEELLNKLMQRVLYHDVSKYSLEEYDAYRKHFFPINTKEKEANKEDFQKAVEHHWRNNSHHWQHRQFKTSFNKNNDEQVLDVLENVLDWMAMGYQFGNRPYQYYESHKDSIKLCKEEKIFLEQVIYEGVDLEYIMKEQEKRHGRRK